MSSTHFYSFALLVAAGSTVACGATSERTPAPANLAPDVGVASDAVATDAAPDTNAFELDSALPIGDDAAACATAEAAAIKKPVDIIIVIDQSGSMDLESVQVRDNINKLAGYLAATNLDYRVVMIAGLPGNGALPMCVPTPLAADGCQSKPPRFRAVNRHIESNDPLKWILATYDSTDPGTKWSDFLRPDAMKVFIPITDDNATDTTMIPAPQSTNFDQMLLSRGNGTFGTTGRRKYVVYPICGVSTGATSVKCATAVNTGPVYVELATLTKGLPFSVCESSYEPVFKAIGKAIATSVACEVTVPPAPEGETFDPNKVNVIHKDSGGGATTIPQDNSSDCAVGANGWQYSLDGTKILLCGDACAAAKSDPNALISVQFGCGTIVK